MFSLEEFEADFKISDGFYHINLSTIPCEQFDSFKATLNQILNSIEGLTLSCIYSQNLDSHNEEEIQNLVGAYFHGLLYILRNLLLNSKIFKEIQIVNIKNNLKDIIELASYVKLSRNLMCFFLNGIKIGDNNIYKITKHLEDSQIQYVSFRQCDLTNECIPTIVEYITNVRKKYKEKGLLQIDLSDNEITQKYFNKVIEALKSIPTDSNSEESEREQLLQENEALKIQIDRMKGMLEEIQNNDALFIVGDGSYAVIEKMKEITKRLNNLKS